MTREKRLNALMIETITEIKNTMRKTIQVKQHISRAPQWMKIKERILEKVAMMLIYINYNKKVRKLHDTGWKNSYHTSADVYMLGYGCGVSQYPRFLVEYLDMYQMLPRPCLRSFDGVLGDKIIIKWVLDLANQAETFV